MFFSLFSSCMLGSTGSDFPNASVSNCALLPLQLIKLAVKKLCSTPGKIFNSMAVPRSHCGL